MEMFDYFKKAVFENYANFSGRARRKEYWYFCLTLFILNMLMQVVSAISSVESSSSILVLGLSIVLLLAYMCLIIPNISLSIRRLHDIGKSGWYLLIGFIPLVGGIILLVWFCREGETGPNKWGPDPKDPTLQNEVLNAFK
ncbi:MAG: DUF805 domain-containing protein [Bacteroidales bacterium]|nr:DUF805 domain-containing protein [Bacteroidales bacterium]